MSLTLSLDFAATQAPHTTSFAKDETKRQPNGLSLCSC